MGSKYSLAIFDLDGTLADTSSLIFDSFNFVARKYRNMELTPQQIMSYFGPPEEVALKNIFGDGDFDSLWRDYLDYYKDHSEKSSVFDGIREILVRLKDAGCKLAVFTGKGDHTTELTLSHHDMKSLFDLIVTGSMLKNHKPDPEGVELALKTLRVRPPDAVVVGDSLSDYKAATAAGVNFIAATYDSLARNRFDKIDCAKAASVGELSELLLDGK